MGTTPRLLPEDFELRSRYGVGRDWPVSYDDLRPYYAEAEKLLGVAGQATDLMPGAEYPLPAHPLSPQDTVVAPLLEPFIPLPQARPTLPVRGRAACCAAMRCMRCPVDARFSVLNGLGDVLNDPRVQILDETIAAQLVPERSPGRVAALDCIRADGEHLRLEGQRFVVAANALESTGLLLRSGIDGGDTGRNLLDHACAEVLVRTRTPVGPARGSSWQTGASYAYYGGDFRSHHAALLVIPRNVGAPLDAETVARGLIAGRRGRGLQREVVDQWNRTLMLRVLPDELPSAANRVTLSGRKDRFGLPLNHVQMNEQSDYQMRAIRALLDDLPRRLRPLGVRDVRVEHPMAGSHILGTLRMGADADAVLDPDGRHRRYENLFVSGGAAFPSMSPSHPTLTISALAIRLGGFLAGK
jgi:choline dehydrogenase-like flavoprotein